MTSEGLRPATCSATRPTSRRASKAVEEGIPSARSRSSPDRSPDRAPSEGVERVNSQLGTEAVAGARASRAPARGATIRPSPLLPRWATDARRTIMQDGRFAPRRWPPRPALPSGDDRARWDDPRSLENLRARGHSWPPSSSRAGEVRPPNSAARFRHALREVTARRGPHSSSRNGDGLSHQPGARRRNRRRCRLVIYGKVGRAGAGRRRRRQGRLHGRLEGPVELREASYPRAEKHSSPGPTSSTPPSRGRGRPDRLKGGGARRSSG